jgi:hypothetical protein
MNQNPLEHRQESLASQIHDNVVTHVKLTRLDQTGRVYCAGPEQVLEVFLEALSKYPNSIFKLPISIVLIEVSMGTETVGKRRLKKACSNLDLVISRALENGNVVVRYGKTRFAVLLLDADENLAGKICQRIKEAIHRHWFINLKLKAHLVLEFAISEHSTFGGNDFAELIFGNERDIRVARALGDGAIIKHHELKAHFQEHDSLNFQLGEIISEQYLESQKD